MSLSMPKPEAEILRNRKKLIERLHEILSADNVISQETQMRAYECDGLTMYRQLPLVVVLPETVEQVSRIMSLANEMNVKVVPRGAGTSLSGGSLPLEDGILLTMTRLNKILEIDFPNRCVRVQPGVTNLSVTKAIEHKGFYYAPDPSSQIACSIGGNVGENAGGVHCLKYGLTTNNILGLEIVLMDGSIIQLGGKHLDTDLYDVIGLMTGSEGLLGMITEVTLRILQKPQAIGALLLGFPTVEAGADCVTSIISAGIIPAGLEMMDALAIRAAEEFQSCGYPLDAESLLVCELDGTKAEVEHLIERVSHLGRTHGAEFIEIAKSEQERLQFWAGRKNAFPAVGAIGPDYMCMDGTIPRNQLGHVLREIKKMSGKYGLRCANVFHAGDGNLHPLILYNANKPGDLEKVEKFGADILKLCVSVGGVLTGEHGVGVEKRDLMPTMFSEIDLKQQQRVKCAFDPDHRLNPGKVFPTLHRCAELGKMHVHQGKLPFPDIPRF